MTYIPTTKEVRFDATFYDGMGGPITPEGFDLWLSAVIEDAHLQGQAYEGCGGVEPMEDVVKEILGEWVSR